MIERQEIQLKGELAVRRQLVECGHVILGHNVRRAPYEFDIITQFEGETFVHEVRTTMSIDSAIISHFPAKKILTLLTGIEKHFPTAILYCYLVRILDDNRNTITKYLSYELL